MRFLLSLSLLLLCALSAFSASAEPLSSVCSLFDLKQVWSKLSDSTDSYRFTLSVLEPSTLLPSRASLHYRINSGDIQNQVLIQPSTNPHVRSFSTDKVKFNGNDIIHSFVTFAYNQTVCDTNIYETVIPSSSLPIRAQNSMNMNNNQVQSQVAAEPKMLQAEENTVYDQNMLYPVQESNSYAQQQAAVQTQTQSTEPIMPNEHSLSQIDPGTVSAVCPNMAYEQRVMKAPGSSNDYQLMLVKSGSSGPLEWIDLHFKVNAASEWTNVRLGSDMLDPNAHSQNIALNMQSNTPLTLQPTDRLTYFFTSKLAQTDFACNSPMFSTLVSSIAAAA